MKKIQFFFSVVTTLATFCLTSGHTQTVEIGTQVWMTKNLNVNKFRNGEPIPQAKTNQEWQRAGENKEPAWCYYVNDPRYGEIYGKLYNWYAVADPRGLAPEGWKIPSSDDWMLLMNRVGFGNTSGKALKNTSGWARSGNGSNKYQFSALPGGGRGPSGDFDNVSYNANFWSSTARASGVSTFILSFDKFDFVTPFPILPSCGSSIRCIRE